MATKKIKINFKMPTPTAAERLHAQQQKNRKAAGLPDPSEYKKKLDAMKSEETELVIESIHNQIKKHLDAGHTVHSKAVGRIGQITHAHDGGVQLKSKGRTAATTFSKGDKVKLVKKTDTEYHVVNEEVEQLDEISDKLKASYVSGAKKQIKQSMPFTKKSDEYRDIAKNFIAKRQKGIARANEEVELLDEMPESNMKVRDVHSHLKKAGWELARSKGGHDVFKHPKAKHSIPVPRHSLKAPLVRGIMKASKVEEQLEKKGRFVSGPIKQPFKSNTIVTSVKEDADPCWKGYKMVGMKDKNGRKVPNCVPGEGVPSMKKEDVANPTEGEMKGKQQGVSRKAQIVRDAAKGKKSDNPDKFQKDPELSSEIHKT